MKILIIINSLGGGGAERVAANLANYWAAKGWEITILTLGPKSEDSYKLDAAIQRIELNFNLVGQSSNALTGLFRNFRRVLAIRQILRKTKPNIALGMMTTANILLALASWRLRKIKTIGSEHTYPPQFPLGAIWERLRRYSYSRLDALVALTSEGSEWIRLNTNAKRVVVIPNPVSWPLSNQNPHLSITDIYPMDKKILLAVGRLSSEKQFGLLVDSFKSIENRHPEWILVILGEGPLRPALESQVKMAGLENRIYIPGRAGNVGDWYARANLFVLCSLFEGFPNVLVEAMAYGLPAVSFDCDTGPRDLIHHGVNGFLVPPGNVDGLTSALDQLMGDHCMQRRFGMCAVEIRERFAIELVAKKWVYLFDEVCI